MEQVEKVWGTEEIIVNNDLYCGKFLNIAPGYQCSLHYHVVKDETFFVAVGKVDMQVGDEAFVLNEGESVRILPGTPHRFGSRSLAVIIEISTPHSDDDVVRLEPSGRY